MLLKRLLVALSLAPCARALGREPVVMDIGVIGRHDATSVTSYNGIDEHRLFTPCPSAEYPPFCKTAHVWSHLIYKSRPHAWKAVCDSDTFILHDTLSALITSLHVTGAWYLGSPGRGRPHEREFLKLTNGVYAVGGSCIFLTPPAVEGLKEQRFDPFRCPRPLPEKYLHTDVEYSECFERHGVSYHEIRDHRSLFASVVTGVLNDTSQLPSLAKEQVAPLLETAATIHPVKFDASGLQADYQRVLRELHMEVIAVTAPKGPLDRHVMLKRLAKQVPNFSVVRHPGLPASFFRQSGPNPPSAWSTFVRFGLMKLKVPEWKVRSVLKSESSCYFAHLAAGKRAYEQGSAFTLIVEDDVSLNRPGLGRALEAITREMEAVNASAMRLTLHASDTTWETLWSMAALVDVLAVPVDTKSRNSLWGSGAYVLSRRGAEEMVALANGVNPCVTARGLDITADKCLLGEQISRVFLKFPPVLSDLKLSLTSSMSPSNAKRTAMLMRSVEKY